MAEDNEMPDSKTVLAHGVTQRANPQTEIDYLSEEIRRKGYVVIPDVFSREEMQHAKESLYGIYSEQASEVGGVEVLKKINDANVVRCPLVFDDFFVSMTLNETFLSLAKNVLGNNVCLSSQVGIINRPDFKNYQEWWHRELQYQHFTSSKPMAVQALVAIDDFTPDNGGTFFLPGSHLFEEFPSDRYVLNNEVQISAPSGSAIVFDSMVYHRGAPNHTSTDRVAVNNLFTQPIIQQQIDIAKMLGGRFSTDPTHRQLFGYEWNPAESIKSWRMQRVERADKNAK
jgi:ectoine hydroxylase-related dioxygenase (phytanoyl-CoA dioxygenase family)